MVDAPDRVAAAVDALWGRFRSRLFSAWLELWVAARTDSALHAEVAVLEERIRQAIATQVHHLFGEGGADAGTADQAYRATIYLRQGMALERSVGTADERTQRQSQAAALDLWKRVLTDVLRPSR